MSHVTPAGTEVLPCMKFTCNSTLYHVMALSGRSGDGVRHDQTLITYIAYKKTTDPVRDDYLYPQLSAEEFDRSCTLVRKH